MAYSDVQVVTGALAHIPVLIGVFKFYDNRTSKGYEEQKAAEAEAKAAEKAAADAQAKAAAKAKAAAEAEAAAKAAAEKAAAKAAAEKAAADAKQAEESSGKE